MKLPSALEVLKNEFGDAWTELSGEVKDDMLGTFRQAERLLKRNLAGEATPKEWTHVKAQSVAWEAGAKATAEKAWWRALKRYAELLGVALVEGVKLAARGALKGA